PMGAFMCDTMVIPPQASPDGMMWFGKNSDREPSEAQAIEHYPARQNISEKTLRCTYVEIPQVGQTHEVLLSRPCWMWGAEIGVNEHGVAIGNQAVFTRMPVAKTRLTGMDLVRVALERATSAGEALQIITGFLADPGQGGACGFRDKNFSYHNAFII